MSEDETPVPQPNEADRDDDAIRYHKVDETNVSGTDPSRDQDDGNDDDAGHRTVAGD